VTVPIKFIATDSSLKDVQRALVARLKAAGLETPDLDARLLLMEATGLSRTELVVNNHDVMPSQAARLLESYVGRRLSGEPIDAIFGHQEFYGRRFDISKDVLSPRPETEGLVGHALQRLEGLGSPRILDLGTGSGAILITLLLESPAAAGVGIDMSPAALTMARRNAKVHGLRSRAEWMQSDWYENVEGLFDMVVSNPPYITDAAMEALAPEVANFDPDMSLRGGLDGLEAYAKILAGAGDYLRPGGALILEIGYDQGRSVPTMMGAAGFSNIALYQDLSGHDRVVTGIWGQK